MGACPRKLNHSKERSHGCTADKIKGAANEAIGKAKQGIGEATGSDRLKGEGVVQEVKGKGQKPSATPRKPPRTRSTSRRRSQQNL